MRLRLDLAYDGSGFHGWARQPGLRTVQGELEQALATVLRRDHVEVTVAGRVMAFSRGRWSGGSNGGRTAWRRRPDEGRTRGCRPSGRYSYTVQTVQ